MSDQAISNVVYPPQWNRERIDLIKSEVCPKGIPDGEFQVFIAQCQRSGLDPLIKQAWCVPRKFNVGERSSPHWVTRYVFEPAESGMLARAEKFSDFGGCTAQAVYSEDDILIDAGEGTVTHKFNPGKRKGQLIGAWGRLSRKDKLAIVVWLDLSGYVQDGPLWRKIPANMMEKCARASCLRKAYPEAFGGLYIREEMPEGEYGERPKAQAANDMTADAEPVRPEQSRTAQAKRMVIAGRLATEGPKALPEPNGVPALSVGKKAGLPVAQLSSEDLSRWLEWAKGSLAKATKPAEKARYKAEVKKFVDEAQRRSDADWQAQVKAAGEPGPEDMDPLTGEVPLENGSAGDTPF